MHVYIRGTSQKICVMICKLYGIKDIIERETYLDLLPPSQRVCNDNKHANVIKVEVNLLNPLLSNAATIGAKMKDKRIVIEIIIIISESR